jgi:hypothetical protein
MSKPGTFQKGDDPRRNNTGRPSNFKELRTLALKIANEKVDLDGTELTRIERIMRTWADSDNPTLVQKYVETTYGKVPDKLEISGEDGAPWTVVVKQFTPKPEEE